MKIAIIGGSGFLGCHLRSELGKRNCQVRLITSRKELNPEGIEEVVPVTFSSASEIADALFGCDSIVYLSGINHEKSPGDFVKIHVEYLRMVMNAAKASSINNIIYTSFLRARSHQTSKYLQSKWDGEELLRSSSMHYTILRPGICFGPGDQMTTSIARGLKMTPFLGFFASVGLREPTMRPVHAQDVALIMAEALLAGGMERKTYNVSGPEELTLSEAVRRVARVIGKRALIANVPVPLMFAGAWAMEHVMKNSLVTVSQIRMLADGLSDCPPMSPDTQLLPERLKPKTYFTEQQIQVTLKQIR
ncbi:MAG TPA: NAD(P)H-binding protein [Oculatellaceae cyanobacterium]